MRTNRRKFLTSSSLGVGALVLGPMLRQLQAQAATSAPLPRRFLFVVEGNGLPWQQIQPPGIERGGSTLVKAGVATVANPESRPAAIHDELRRVPGTCSPAHPFPLIGDGVE